MGRKTKFFMFGAEAPFGLGFTTRFKVFNQLLAIFDLGRVAGLVQVKYSMLIMTGMDRWSLITCRNRVI